ncbi:Ig-like domain-containing protein, partial [Nocardioides hankookensis]
RLTGTSGGDGVARIQGLPDGPVSAYVWADGYRPASVAAQLADGRADATVTLETGEVGSVTLDQHEMTIEEIQDAGIDVADPENYHVYEATINLFFVPDVPAADVPPPQEISVYVTPTGVICYDNCGNDGGGGGGGDGGGGGVVTFGDYQWIPEVTYVEEAPVIQWLVLPMRASWLKEFFEVKLVVSNLTTGFTFTDGVASLPLPSGLSLAPTATPQQATQAVGDVPGGGSRSVTWIVRGDEEGAYDIEAEYSATVSPLDKTVRLVGRSRDPLKVDGAGALETSIVLDCRATRWAPYAFDVRVHNVSTAPVYNFQVEMLDRAADAPETQADFFYAPSPAQVQGTAAIAPDGYWTASYVVYPGLGNDEVKQLRLVLGSSFVQRTGGDVDLAPKLETRDDPCPEDPNVGDSSLAPRTTPITVTIPPAGDRAELTWARPAAPDGLHVTGYTLYARQSLRGGGWTVVNDHIATHSDGDESYTIPASQHAIGRYYALGTLYSDGSVHFQHQLGIGPARYVALGDSFSAGEGVPAFEPGTAKDYSPVTNHEKYGDDNLCHRSAQGSYSRILANDRSLGLEPAVFHACSGAVAADIWSDNRKEGNENVRAQDQEVNQFTDVVTMTLGGNDIGFADIAQSCVIFDCTGQILAGKIIGDNPILNEVAQMWDYKSAVDERISTLIGGGKCLHGIEKAVKIAQVWCAVQVARSINKVVEMGTIDPDRFSSPRNLTGGQLEDRLVRAYTDIATRAPHARIYVGGYPQLVDMNGSATCDLLLEDLPVVLSLGKNERTFVYWLVAELNDRIQAAIATANKELGGRISYVDASPATAFGGKELCRGDRLNESSGFNSVVNPYFSTPNNYGPVAFSLHPNKYGQQAYATEFKGAMGDDLKKNLLSYPGQDSPAGDVFVPYGARNLTVTTSIPGSTVTPRIYSPSGDLVPPDAPGVSVTSTATTTTTVITDPAPGTWRVEVHGDDVAEDGEPTTVMAYAEPAPVTPPEAHATAHTVSGTVVEFDGSTSTAGAGATYRWVFSDGASANGVTVQHDFGDAPSRSATLEVADDSGTSFDGAGIELPNHAPVAQPDTAATPKDVTLDLPAPGLLANDSDADDDLIWSTVVTEPVHGTLTLLNTGALTYVPEPGWEGYDTFTYATADGDATSEPATVRIKVGNPRTSPAITLDVPTSATYDIYAPVSGEVVADPPPTAKATVSLDGAPLGDVVVVEGVGSIDVPAGTAAGTHTLVASYAG